MHNLTGKKRKVLSVLYVIALLAGELVDVVYISGVYGFLATEIALNPELALNNPSG